MDNQLTKIEEKKPTFDIELVKRTIARDATDDELKLFIYTAQRTGLDPLTRQIHFVKRGGQMTIQTGIDGYRVIAERSGALAGIDDAVFDNESGTHPNKATVTVWKIVNNIRVSFSSSARWSEYCVPTSPIWKKMPYLMLAKCAEALALRKAFPNDLTGIYTNEEMQQADAPQVVETVPQNVVKTTTAPVAKSSPPSTSPKCPGFDGSGKCGAPLTGTYQLCYNCNLKKKYGSPTPKADTGELTPEEMKMYEKDFNQ